MSDARPYRSVVAVVTAMPGHILLGGVTRHESARMPHLPAATSWADTVIECNRAAGRETCHATYVFSYREPEITAEMIDPGDEV